MTNRDRKTKAEIVETANRLFYEHGFERTSLSDIANAGNLKKGNFFYHFKTKSEILSAVIDKRLAESVAFLKQLEVESIDPSERITNFVRSKLINKNELIQHGCGLGALCAELAKIKSPALPNAREELLLYKNWLIARFAELGYPEEAVTLSMRLLVRVQGATILAQSFEDPSITSQEIENIVCWLQNLHQATSAGIVSRTALKGSSMMES